MISSDIFFNGANGSEPISISLGPWGTQESFKNVQQSFFKRAFPHHVGLLLEPEGGRGRLLYYEEAQQLTEAAVLSPRLLRATTRKKRSRVKKSLVGSLVRID